MQQNQVQAKSNSGKLRVNRDNLAKKHIPTWVVFCYHLNQDKFKKAFAAHGVAVNNEEDVASLIRLASSGADVRGEIKDSTGKPLVFNTMRIIDGIDMPLEEIKVSLREKFDIYE